MMTQAHTTVALLVLYYQDRIDSARERQIPGWEVLLFGSDEQQRKLPVSKRQWVQRCTEKLSLHMQSDSLCISVPCCQPHRDWAHPCATILDSFLFHRVWGRSYFAAHVHRLRSIPAHITGTYANPYNCLTARLCSSSGDPTSCR